MGLEARGILRVFNPENNQLGRQETEKDKRALLYQRVLP